MVLNTAYQQYKKVSIAWRAEYFQPILKFLASKKITANQITIFRLFFLIPLIYFFYKDNLFGVLVAYGLFWFLDLFDGALARYLQQANDKGRFFDTIVDNFAYGILMIGFIYLQSAWLWLLAANLLFEFTVQVLGVIKKQPEVQTDWLLKAEADLPYFKSVSHLALFLYFIGRDYLNIVYFLLDLSLLVTAGYLFLKIKDSK